MPAGEQEILVQRLYQVLGNIRSAGLPPILCAAGTAWTLSNDVMRWPLTAWCTAIAICTLLQYGWARHVLATGIATSDATRTMRWLVAMHAVSGALWGILPWFTLGVVSVPGSMLVVAMLAGIGGGTLALLSPVLPVFIAFIFFEVIGLALALLALDDPAYYAISAASVLFA
jgi:hypothetical protein